MKRKTFSDKMIEVLPFELSILIFLPYVLARDAVAEYKRLRKG